MTYVDGFVAAVPAANKDTYTRHATDAAPLFREFGATRLVEGWGDDVPEGKVTDFRGAVKAKEGEVVVFGFMEYPSRKVRDAANKKMLSDPRMQSMGETMPFDGKRMIFGGFESIVDEGNGQRGGYLDGYLVPVPESKKQAYVELAKKAAKIFREHGAIRVVEAWGDDVPDGKVTDYKRAVKSKKDEGIVYSWVEWPDKATRVEGWKKVMEDPRMQPGKEMPFDGARLVYGGFAPIVDK